MAGIRGCGGCGQFSRGDRGGREMSQGDKCCAL